MKILTKDLKNNALPVSARIPFLRSYSGVIFSGYFEEDGVVLPFVIRKKFIFKWIQIDNNPYGCTDKEHMRSFLDNVTLFVKKNLKVSHIITTNLMVCEVVPSDAIACKWGTYIVDLTYSVDELFANIHSKHKNVIRKALSNNMKVFHGKEYEKEAITLIADTYSRQGKRASFNEGFASRLNLLGEYVDYWIIKDSDGIIHGSAVFIWSPNQTCFYLHGGSSAKTATGAMNLLIWEAMQAMKERSVHYFDFVGARVNPQPGSKLEGIQRFKNRFGSTMKVGWMYKVIINKFYYYLYKIALNVFSLLNGNGIYEDNIEQEIQRGN